MESLSRFIFPAHRPYVGEDNSQDASSLGESRSLYGIETSSVVDGEEDGQDVPVTSSLHELVSLWGKETTSVIQNSTLTEILSFALTATERQVKVFDAGEQGFPKLVRLVGKDVIHGVLLLKFLGKQLHPAVRRQTAWCLANICLCHESRARIRSDSPGVLRALLDVLIDDEVELNLLEEVTRCLSNLALLRDNSVEVVSHPGGLNVLVNQLRKGGSIRLVIETIKCLTNLAESRENQWRIGDCPQAIDSLVGSIVKSRNPTVCIEAVRCLTKLTALEEIKVKILSHRGVLDALVSLLGARETAQVQRQSVKCLIILADHCQQRKLDTVTFHPGVLDAMERLLRSNWITRYRILVQKEAGKCLLKLVSASEECSVKIASHPRMLETLVKCLGMHTLQRVQNLVLECLRDLLAVSRNQKKVATQPGALAEMIRMVSHEVNRTGQVLAASCLRKLAVLQETRIILVSYPGILDAFVSLLGRETSSILLDPIIRCIASLAHSTNMQVKIGSHPGVLEAFLNLLEKEVDPTMLEQIAYCLSLLALAPENAQKIVSYVCPGAIAALLNLVVWSRGAGRDDPMSTGVLYQTIKCLTNLSEWPKNQKMIAAFPGILEELWLLVMMEGVERIVQEEVLSCLAKLSESQYALILLSNPGACQALKMFTVPYEENWTAKLHAQAVRCLGNLDCRLEVDESVEADVSGGRNFLQTRNGRQPDSSDFLDPITNKVMCDPVRCTDGKIYDRWTIIDFNIVRRPNHSQRNEAGTSVTDTISFGIEADDVCLRERLFEAWPEQEEKFFARQRKYREEALQHARADEFKVAVEMLGRALQCKPSDAECREQLERISTHLEQMELSIDPDRWDMDPLTHDRMCDPVKCNDGRTYDRWTIIDQDITKCPYDPNLKPFFIACDDLNVRQRLFEEFPDVVVNFRGKRYTYRESALQHSRIGEVEEAVKKLKNVLLWAPADKQCSLNLEKNLNLLRDQTSRIAALRLTKSKQNTTWCKWLDKKRIEDPELHSHPEFLDPITMKLMCDPVKCTDGNTYDRWTIIDFNLPDHPRWSKATNSYHTDVNAFGIETDDVELREQLFEIFPEQEVEFFARQEKYREETLQHAQADKFHDAIRKLSNVLKFNRWDTECQDELKRISHLLEQIELSADPYSWDMDPITYCRMCDPVKCNDGRTYDRWTIIDGNLEKCPYDSNLKPFCILVDDLNVRMRLFEEFTDVEANFRSRRATYRESALQHSRKGEVEEAVKKLKNVLLWAPTDELCRSELEKNLNYPAHQTSRIPVVRHDNSNIPVILHEDLIREANESVIAQIMSLPGAIVLCLLCILWLQV